MENLKYIKVVYPYEGKVSVDTLKRRACDVLQNEEDRKVDPKELSLREAMDICEHYGVAAFVWPD